MNKKTKTNLLIGSAITILSAGIGYGLYTLNKTKKAKRVKETDKIIDDYKEYYEGREYTTLDLPQKEDTKGRQK